MKFLVWSTVVCVVSFILSGILYGNADFTDVKNNFKSGRYNFQYSINDEDKDFGEIVENFKSSEVKKIEIRSSISEVIVESKNVEKIELRVEFLNEEVQKTYQSKLENGVLQIDTGEDSENKSFSSFFGNKKNGCKINLTIPRGVTLDYDFQLAIGSLEMENISIGSFRTKLAAGNIEMEDVEFISADIKAAAGNIVLKDIKVSEKIKVKAAAGNVTVKFDQEDPNVDIKATAGNIEVSFSGDLKPNLVFSSLSTVGELSVRKDFKSQYGSAYTYGEGQGRIEVKSTFGNVKFK